MPRTNVTVQIDADLAAAVRLVAEAEHRDIRDVYESAVRSYLGGPAGGTARVELLKLLDRVAAQTVGAESVAAAAATTG